MAAFEYVALDQAGRQQKGVLEGDSGRQVRQLLRDRGLMPVSVDTARQRAERPGIQFTMTQSMGALDQALFTRQLATLISAGLPVEEALSAVSHQTEKRRVGSMIMAVRSKVLEGHALASALGEYPRTFNQMYRSTVAAGEQSGHLDVVLENLADFTERRFESTRNVQMALFYPVALLVLAVLLVGALLVWVVPDIVRVFENTGEDLPPLTAALIASSDFVRQYFWFLLGGGAAIVFGVRAWLAQDGPRLAWDRRVLRWPFLGKIARGTNAARYTGTLAILTSAGVPLVEAMTIAREVVVNLHLRNRLADAVARVSEGASLRAALEGVGYFPPMFLHMIASGESSGELDTMLAKVSEHQQRELERIVNAVVRMFEPFMLLVMGGMVMLIVLAILLPILNMNQLVV